MSDVGQNQLMYSLESFCKSLSLWLHTCNRQGRKPTNATFAIVNLPQMQNIWWFKLHRAPQDLTYCSIEFEILELLSYEAKSSIPTFFYRYDIFWLLHPIQYVLETSITSISPYSSFHFWKFCGPDLQLAFSFHFNIDATC